MSRRRTRQPDFSAKGRSFGKGFKNSYLQEYISDMRNQYDVYVYDKLVALSASRPVFTVLDAERLIKIYAPNTPKEHVPGEATKCLERMVQGDKLIRVKMDHRSERWVQQDAYHLALAFSEEPVPPFDALRVSSRGSEVLVFADLPAESLIMESMTSGVGFFGSAASQLRERRLPVEFYRLFRIREAEDSPFEQSDLDLDCCDDLLDEIERHFGMEVTATEEE